MINSKVAMRRHRALKRWWSDETRLSQEILIAVLWHLENPTNKLQNRIKGLKGYITRLKKAN